MKVSTVIQSLTLLGSLMAAAAAVNTTLPTATVLNGTYSGVYSETYDQDFFLGMPYLAGGGERFHAAQALSTSWTGVVAADSYAPNCVGFGEDNGVETSEDCLYLNVVRPHSATNSSQLLPVVVYFHGGGYYSGGSADPQYNLSFIVQESVQNNQPIIAVSFNYRLSIFGFLYNNELMGSGATNVGLRDQRSALTWVQENLEAFGGDPTKVTLWGSGSGASAVGLQIAAYHGRNDSLLRAAILESGAITPPSGFNGTEWYQPLYNDLITKVGPTAAYAATVGLTSNQTCVAALDQVACIRNATTSDIVDWVKSTNTASAFQPIIDGDIVRQSMSRQLENSQVVMVPIIIGANTDEGTFFTPSTITTNAGFDDLIANSQNYAVPPGIRLPEVLVTELQETYLSNSTSAAASAATYQGDAAIIALRRATAKAWCNYAQTKDIETYVYRFDIPTLNSTSAQHGAQIPFTLNNTGGVGLAVNPFENAPATYRSMAKFISSSWISFISTLDPNAWRTNDTVPYWPVYEFQVNEQFVFSANGSSYIEIDDYREDGIRLINGGSAELGVAYNR